MLKKTIIYTDFNGKEQKEDHFFNLTKAELVDMETSIDGGLGEHIQKIVDTKKMSDVIGVLKTFIDKSYGKKSEDGRRFIKDPQDLKEFKETEAYSTLFMDLATNSEEAAAFFNGIVPAQVAEQMQQEAKKQGLQN